MGIPVLLAATATKWAGPARLPRELVQAGFDVAVLAPRGALVAESRYVATVSHLPDTATPIQWLFMLAASVERWAPRLIVPCDDTTLQLMVSFVEESPKELNGPHRERLLSLIRDSLGAPEYYRTSIDKTLLPPAAKALGVRAPPYAVIAKVAAARSFAQTHGYPVVLKRAFGTAGDAVEVVPDQARLEPAFRKLLSSAGTSLWNSDKLLIQAWIPGKGLFARRGGLGRHRPRRYDPRSADAQSGDRTLDRCALPTRARGSTILGTARGRTRHKRLLWARVHPT